MGRIKSWTPSRNPAAIYGTRSRFALFLLFLACGLWPMASNLYSQTELGSEDDLTVLGVNGTAADPDAEIKGFTVFGATQAAYTGAVVGAGNVVVNGRLAVSSGAYFVGGSTFAAGGAYFTGVSSFSNVTNIHVAGGTANQVLKKVAGGGMAWDDVSAMVAGDNLGTHIATQTLSMASWNIVNVSSVNFKSSVFLTSATAANYGGVYVSTHIYTPGSIYAGALYGDGSGLTGIAARTYVTRALAAAANSYIYIGNFSVTNGAHNLYVAVTVSAAGFSVAKQYALPMYNNMTGASWQVALPVSNTGPGVSGDDFALEVNVSGATATLRLRRTAGSAAGTALVSMETIGPSADIFTSDSTTGTDAAAYPLLAVTAITQVGGNIGISAGAPQARMDMVAAGASDTDYLHIWRNSSGVIVASMTSTGKIFANLSAAGTGDNLGDHTATTQLKLGNYAVWSSSSITAARYQINGSTVLAILPGVESIAVGPNTGSVNTGNYSVFVGSGAGAVNTTGAQDTFVGHSAGYANAGGAQNTFVGYAAGYKNAGAWYNTFLGVNAGYNNISGQNNTFLGNGAGLNNTGGNNTYLGYYAGSNGQGGGGNIVIGYNQALSAPAAGNELNIGGVLYGDLSAKTIGIGTAAPGAKLDVTGMIRSTWAFSPGDGVNFQSSRYMYDDSANYRTAFSSNVYIVGYASVTVIRGLSAPLTDDSAASKAYVDAALDTCALGNATAADIVQGKSADINCDNFAEAGTLATQTLAVSTDEVKTGVYAATWLSVVDTDLAPANIRAGYDIFGHAGTFTSGATAGAGDIMNGLTAGVNGTIITGTLPTRTLSPASNNVLAGYYNATTLSAVDTDLAAGNIAVSTVVFGVTGTYTSDANAVAADMLSGKTAYVNGVKLTGSLATVTLSPASNNVNAGYYNATTLSAVDTDLAASNIAVSTVIFGVTGTYTSDANAVAADMLSGKTAYVNGVKITGTVPAGSNVSGGEGLKTFTITDGLYSGNKTATANDTDLAAGNIKKDIVIFGVTGTLETAPPAPAVGGTWLLVPGDSSLGTMDFYVQKYEAKNVSSLPTSQASGTPWVSVTQTEAKNRCEALGAGYHLITMQEAQTINRNIENTAWNWTGGSVGSGGLWRGHTDNSPANSLAADVTGDPDDDPYVGTGNTTPSIERRVHQLSSGQSLWDWSGNVWEWVDMTCTAGTGAGYWYNSAAWVEWSDGNLSDYEKGRAGPAGAYTSTHNAGRYYGCSATGNAVLRGGSWGDGADAGVFAFDAGAAPSGVGTAVGFRCGR